MEILLTAITVLLLGLVLGYLLGRKSKQAEHHRLLNQQKEEMNRMLQEKETRIEELKLDWNEQKTELRTQYEHQLTERDRLHEEALKAQERHQQKALEEMQKKFNETMGRVSAQMKADTQDMLKERQKEFAESSQTNLGQIVTPLRETIDKMKKAMDESTLKQTAMSGEMKANLEQMMRQSEAARKTAEELTRVFKHGSKVQGDWGETVLNELLESQGLTNGIHYDTQAVIRDAQGKVVTNEKGSNLRPDVILHLDTRRELIIDSKVSLTAFIDYVNAETEADREQFLKAHIDSLQKHVKELSVKDYTAYIQAPKVRMDYVIMFVPHSGALWTALHAQPDLWRKAMERNVFIADEQTLFAALRIINMTWTQIAQAENHERVFKLANEMIDRVGQFCKRYDALGQALHKAQQAYEEGQKKLAPTGQSITQTANKLLKLGAKQSDKNPVPELLDIDDIPAIATTSPLPPTQEVKAEEV